MNQNDLAGRIRSLKIVPAAGGSGIAKREDISGGNWGKIRDNCRNAVALVGQLQTG
jgi:hypothetical protein